MTLNLDILRTNLVKYKGYLEVIGVPAPVENGPDLTEEFDSDLLPTFLYPGQGPRSRTSSLITIHSTSSRHSSYEPSLELNGPHTDPALTSPRRRSSATDTDNSTIRSDTHSRSEDHATDDARSTRRRNSIKSQASIPELSETPSTEPSGTSSIKSGTVNLFIYFFIFHSFLISFLIMKDFCQAPKLLHWKVMFPEMKRSFPCKKVTPL